MKYWKNDKGICYSGFREGQSPRTGICPSYAEVEEDLRILLERHREGLTLFLFGFVRNMEDAEELMLDAFAIAASGTSRFSGSSSFKTWLFAIGRNQAMSMLRKNRLRFFTYCYFR